MDFTHFAPELRMFFGNQYLKIEGRSYGVVGTMDLELV